MSASDAADSLSFNGSPTGLTAGIGDYPVAVENPRGDRIVGPAELLTGAPVSSPWLTLGNALVKDAWVAFSLPTLSVMELCLTLTWLGVLALTFWQLQHP